MRELHTHMDRAPETFSSAQLLAKDFDSTVALTSEISPSGIGLNEVHEIVIANMFGARALDTYIKAGGLRSRSPIEIVKDIAPDASEEELNEIKSAFVKMKLSIFLGEIGTRFPDGEVWPRPTPGYLEIMESIELARTDGRLIDDAIISSGHEQFIKKTYTAWGIKLPGHLVAEDSARLELLDLPYDQRIKPSPVLMDLARLLWRESYYSGEAAVPEGSDEELSRILYVGDAPTKDGDLAKNSKVGFVLIDENAYRESWQNVARKLQLGNTALMQGY